MGVKMFVLANAYYWRCCLIESPNGVRSGRQPGWDEPTINWDERLSAIWCSLRPGRDEGASQKRHYNADCRTV